MAHAPEIWHKANFSDAKPLGSPSVDFSAGKMVSMCLGDMELLNNVSCVYSFVYTSNSAHSRSREAVRLDGQSLEVV